MFTFARELFKNGIVNFIQKIVMELRAGTKATQRSVSRRAAQLKGVKRGFSRPFLPFRSLSHHVVFVK
jgi:hypothetical protein